MGGSEKNMQTSLVVQSTSFLLSQMAQETALTPVKIRFFCLNLTTCSHDPKICETLLGLYRSKVMWIILQINLAMWQ